MSEELDPETGMPVHLKFPLTKDNQGPADVDGDDFDHWGCWCGDTTCEKWKTP